MKTKPPETGLDALSKLVSPQNEDEGDPQFEADVETVMKLAHKLAGGDIFGMQMLIEEVAASIREEIRDEFEEPEEGE